MKSAEEFIVEAIRKKRIICGEPYYYIKWLGYAEKDNTWEPLRNCNGALNLIREFEANLKQQKQNKSVGARTSKHLANRERVSRRKTDISVTSEGFDDLNLNIENQSTNDEVVIPGSSTFNHPVSKEFRRNGTSSINDEECRKSNSKSASGRKHISDGGPYSRKVLANANFNGSNNRRDLKNFQPKHDSLSHLSTYSTGQIDCAVTSTETHSVGTSNEEYTIEKLKSCSASEIEIVGAEPDGDRVTIGVRALNDDSVFRLDSREVTELWAQVYVSFLESHIRFEDDNS